jgi:sarcosine oxidase delta subunit
MAILISCPNCKSMGDIGGLGFYEGLRFHCPHCDYRYEVRLLQVENAPNKARVRPPTGAAQYDTGHPNPMFIHREKRTDGG